MTEEHKEKTHTEHEKPITGHDSTKHHEHKHTESHHVHKAHTGQHAHKKTVKKSSLWQGVSGVLALLLIVSIMTGGFSKFGGGTPTAAKLTEEEASEKALTFINENLLQPGTEATVMEVADENGLYKVQLDIGGRPFDSYVTKDGGMLFPSAVDLNEEVEAPDAPTTPQQPATPPSVTKSDRPEVEVFVMSHCPYGTQIEKGILPVMKALGDKADIEIKFVNYAMHGEKEVYEQLNQYCIQEEYEDKFIDYLTCFLDAGDGPACMKEIGLTDADIKNCVDSADEEFKVTELLEDKASWSGGRFPQFKVHDAENVKYGVRGSPTLVVNGASASSSRDAQSLLNTICAAFNDAPEECNFDLSGEGNPSPGFGFTPATGANTAAAQCG